MPSHHCGDGTCGCRASTVAVEPVGAISPPCEFGSGCKATLDQSTGQSIFITKPAYAEVRSVHHCKENAGTADVSLSSIVFILWLRGGLRRNSFWDMDLRAVIGFDGVRFCGCCDVVGMWRAAIAFARVVGRLHRGLKR